LVQTIGRAARNAEGRVIMYADKVTGSMERAIGEPNRRRAKQMAYNEEHGITPATVKKNVEDILAGLYQGDTDQSRVTAKIDPAVAGAICNRCWKACATICAKRQKTLSLKRLRGCVMRSNGLKPLIWPCLTIRLHVSRRWTRRRRQRSSLKAALPLAGRANGVG
jgi:hypothetical protein